MKLTDIVKDSWHNIKDTTKKNKNLLIAIPTLLMAPLTMPDAQAQTTNQTIPTPRTQEEYFQLPPSKRHDLIYDLYMNSQDRDIERLKFANNNLYHASNATLQTSPPSGENSIIVIDNPELGVNSVPYVKLTMVGESGGIWRNEARENRDYTTTFPSIFNAMNLDDERAKVVLSLYAGWDVEDIDIKRDEHGQIVHTTYSGPDNRSIIRNRHTMGGESKEHARWMPGTEALFPLSATLDLAGINLDLVYELREHHDIGEGHRVVDEDYHTHLSNLLDECNERSEELYDRNQELAAKLDTLSQDKTKTDSIYQETSSFLNKIMAGAGVFVNHEGEIGYALNIGRPIGDRGRTLSLMGIYFPGSTNEQKHVDEINTTRQPFENFPGTAVSTDTISSWTITDEHSAQGLIGYEVLNNLSLKAGVNFSKQTITDRQRQTNHTYMESSDGEIYDHDSRVQEDTQRQSDKNFDLAIGASYTLGPIKITGLYTPARGEFAAGVTYNINNRK